MATPLPELFAEVPTLNAVGAPAVFTVVESTITGRWDASSATYAQWLAAYLVDERYVLTATFGTRPGRYRLAESGGTGFPFEAGGIFTKAKQLWGVDTEHTLEHSRIREALTEFLAEHGYTRRRGILN